MGAIGPSGFIFRDFIKYLLPTAIAASLFVPFLVPKGNIVPFEGLVFVAVLFGYVIYSPIATLSSFVQSHLPLKSLRLDETRKRYDLFVTRWDMDTLWSTLDKDEREYLYLTQSYFEFYQTTGFYFLVYCLVNLVYFVSKVIPVWPATPLDWNSFWSLLNSIKTPTIINYDVSTWIVIILSGVFTYYLFGDAALEDEYLRGDNGAFDKAARKYQEKNGNIARSIWGQLVAENEEEKPLPSIKVHLKGSNGKVISTATTSAEGTFQFIDVFSTCQASGCQFEVEDSKWQGKQDFVDDAKHNPVFKLKATPK